MRRIAATPERLIWSYESACEALRAEPFRADADPLPAAVDFADDDAMTQIKRAASRAVARPTRIVAFPLQGLPGRPHVVAEFAGELVLERKNNRLIPAHPTTRLPYNDRANLQWIYWGDLVASPGGRLALGPFAVGPWPGADTDLEPTAAPFHGITTDILRAIKPATIITGVTDAIRALDRTHSFLARHYGWPEPAQQRQALNDALQHLNRPRRQRGRKYPDSHYEAIARLYLNLLDQGGTGRILIRLADHLNIPRATARDWIHRARDLEYLTPSRQGRAGAQPGPRLNTA